MSESCRRKQQQQVKLSETETRALWYRAQKKNLQQRKQKKKKNRTFAAILDRSGGADAANELMSDVKTPP